MTSESTVLPDDVLYHITRYLSVHDKIIISWVCRSWRDFSSNISDYWEKTYILSFHKQILTCIEYQQNMNKRLTKLDEQYWRTSCIDRCFLDNHIRMKMALSHAQKYTDSIFSSVCLEAVRHASACYLMKNTINDRLVLHPLFTTWCDNGSSVYVMRSKSDKILNHIRIYAQPIEYEPKSNSVKRINWHRLNKYVTVQLEQDGHDVSYRIICPDIFPTVTDIDGENVDKISEYLGWYGKRHAFHEWYNYVIEDAGELL